MNSQQVTYFFDRIKRIDPKYDGLSSTEEKRERTTYLISYLRMKGLPNETDNTLPTMHDVVITESIKDWEAQVQDIEILMFFIEPYV